MTVKPQGDWFCGQVFNLPEMIKYTIQNLNLEKHISTTIPKKWRPTKISQNHLPFCPYQLNKQKTLTDQSVAYGKALLYEAEKNLPLPTPNHIGLDNFLSFF
jgi:hypothetical protein